MQAAGYAIIVTAPPVNRKHMDEIELVYSNRADKLMMAHDF